MNSSNLELIPIPLEALGKYERELLDDLQRREDRRREAALKVFEALQKLNFDDPPLEAVTDEQGKLTIRNPMAEAFNLEIERSLNFHTIAYFVEQILANEKTSRQTAAALKRHVENHQMKRDVFAWLDQNYSASTSMDSTASAIAGKVVPVAWRTARDWITEWKKLRSASTT